MDPTMGSVSLSGETRAAPFSLSLSLSLTHTQKTSRVSAQETPLRAGGIAFLSRYSRSLPTPF